MILEIWSMNSRAPYAIIGRLREKVLLVYEPKLLLLELYGPGSQTRTDPAKKEMDG